MFAFIKNFCPLSNEDPHVDIHLRAPPMPLRLFRNEAFLSDLVLPFGEYSDVIPLARGDTTQCPRKKVRKIRDTEEIRRRYLNTVGIQRMTDLHKTTLSINNIEERKKKNGYIWYNY